MNILFVTSRAWPAIGGMESFLRRLSLALAERHNVRIVATTIADGPRGRLADSLAAPAAFEPFADGPVRVEPLGLTLPRRLALAPLVTQVLPVTRRYAYGSSRMAASALYARTVAPLIARAAHGHDVLHMWGGDLLGAATGRAATMLGIPFFMTPFAHDGRWGDDLAAAATYRSADAIVALLHDEARVYERLGVQRSRIHVAGVCAAAAPDADGAALRERLRIAGPLVLFLGARRPYKGHDLLAAAAERVAAIRPDATVLFAGPGERISETETIVDLGEVDEETRAALLDAADLLCLPSESEIFPSSFLEAWAAGTPVLASDIPPHVELVEAAGGGLLVRRDAAALAQAIVDALADPRRLRTLGERGRDYWRAHFTPAAVAARYDEIYARAAAPAELAV